MAKIEKFTKKNPFHGFFQPITLKTARFGFQNYCAFKPQSTLATYIWNGLKITLNLSSYARETDFIYFSVLLSNRDLRFEDFSDCITFHFYSEMMESEGGKWEGDFREEVSD